MVKNLLKLNIKFFKNNSKLIDLGDNINKILFKINILNIRYLKGNEEK